ncbi:MFS general substrate transporter [Gloeopeniophorella convolvens]|nr:MFS general substrate transporter [Gloeopeniophorella convolvens]
MLATSFSVLPALPSDEIGLEDKPVPGPPEKGSADVEDPKPSRKYQALLLASGFMMCFQTIGINQTYGIFQEFYTSSRSSISDGPGNDAFVSLIGTIGGGLTWSGSIFVGPTMSRSSSLKPVCLSGAVVMSAGLILASFAKKLWQLFFTQGLLWGAGSSLLYYPIMSLTPPFFNRYRGFAMGVVLAGSGIGGLVFAPVTHALISHLGAPQALRILGIWNIVVCVPVACVVRRPPAYVPGRPTLALARKGVFLVQAAAAFLQAAGNVIPLYYLTTYSTSVLRLSSSKASILLAVNNVINSASRIAMGLLADYVGRQNTMIASVFLSALSVFALWFNAPLPRFIAFVIVYGIFSGGYNALLPTTITEVYGREQYAAVNAAIYFIRGLGSLCGAPVAGAILGSYHRGAQNGGGAGPSFGQLKSSYERVVVYDGVLLLCAATCVVCVRWLDTKAKSEWRWRA